MMHAYTLATFDVQFSLKTLISPVHDTIGCQTGYTTGLTTGWMSVYTTQPVVQPVDQPLGQPVASCKRGITVTPSLGALRLISRQPRLWATCTQKSVQILNRQQRNEEKRSRTSTVQEQISN